MNRILVWDLPTRLFHWLLTAAFAGASGIALAVDDDSPLFQTHMLLGLIAGFLVGLRLIWCIVGTRHARFGSFLFGPKALFGYLRGAFQRAGKRHTGHNPGSAYAIYAMLLLPLGLVLSGVLQTTSEALEEVHEIMAYLLIATVVAHIAGVVWHTIRNRENIALSMIDGRKEADASEAITSSRPLVGVLFLALAAGWAFMVFRGHDAQRSQITVFGQTIRLGEAEEGESGDEEQGGTHGGSRDKDDD